jgi:hypothetical protein
MSKVSHHNAFQSDDIPALVDHLEDLLLAWVLEVVGQMVTGIEEDAWDSGLEVAGLLLTFPVVVREVQVWELRLGPLDRERVPEGFRWKPFRFTGTYTSLSSIAIFVILTN